MPLSDTALRNAKPREKAYRLYDERGLYAEVPTRGNIRWRLKYRIDGREKVLAIGVYPDVGLKAARVARDRAREQIAAGIDPSAAKQAAKASRAAAADVPTVESVAREFCDRQSDTWSEGHSKVWLRRLERDVFPYLGARPVAEVKSTEVLEVLRRIEERGAVETAHRIRTALSQAFRYAIVTQRCEVDPAAAIRGALKPIRIEHYPAPLDPERIGGLLRMIHGYEGTAVVRAAVRIQPYVFVRPGELRTAKWDDIDLDGEHPQWTYIASKTDQPHVVPLAPQVVAILREIKPDPLNSEYVFPYGPKRPMSNGAVLAAYRRLDISGDELVPHGWRAIARTLLAEQLDYPAEAIEMQLAHAVRDSLGRAYNRVKWIEKRRAMMTEWADFLDRLRLQKKK